MSLRILVALVILAWPQLWAQVEPEAIAHNSPTTLDASAESEYKLGTGDVIEIAVFGVEQFRYEVKIGSAGTVTLPYVGAVQASGFTVEEFTEHLTELLDGTLFKEPQVTVIVKQYGSSPIAVFGAVGNPGTYQKKVPDLRLIDLLAEAGGVSSGAGEFVYVQRRDTMGGEPETIKLSLDALFSEGASSLNIPLRAGDVVNIPLKEREPRKTYYVIGEVSQPGVFELPSDHPILLTQAVAAAGGPLRTAKIGKGKLVRVDEAGQRLEIAINFKKMLNGKQADVVVQDKDIIFIPGSNMKTIGYGLLGIIPSAAQSATTGVVVP